MRRLIMAALILLALAGCGTLQEGNPTATTATGAVVVRPSATTATEPQTDPGQPSGGEPSAMEWDAPPPMEIDPSKSYSAVIETTKGSMTVDLFAAEAPKTVNNFVFLARQGFYKNIKFHRIIKDFMIQTGDPQGTGMGGPGYQFEDEFNSNLRHREPGILSMANSGPNTNGSQFFITHAPTPHLDDAHAVFGKVVEGLDVLDAIANSPVQPDARGEPSVPTEDIRILNITITEE